MEENETRRVSLIRADISAKDLQPRVVLGLLLGGSLAGIWVTHRVSLFRSRLVTWLLVVSISLLVGGLYWQVVLFERNGFERLEHLQYILSRWERIEAIAVWVAVLSGVGYLTRVTSIDPFGVGGLLLGTGLVCASRIWVGMRWYTDSLMCSWINMGTPSGKLTSWYENHHKPISLGLKIMVERDNRTSQDNILARRRLLKDLVGAGVGTVTLGLAGCMSPSKNEEGGGDGDRDTSTSGGGDGQNEELPEGVSEEEFTKGPVPKIYRTTVSRGGETRNPDNLAAKSSVKFLEYKEAKDNSAHKPGTACGNCSEFIPDKNGDGFGACAKVQGYIGLHDWCVLYEALPEPSVPNGRTEEELATATVPEPYRTATSLAGEKRKPDSLATQEAVKLQEAVEATKAGLAKPGQSCGNCAEFIPDKNGDGWGACAKVQGYIAVGDWCGLYEHITEALE